MDFSGSTASSFGYGTASDIDSLAVLLLPADAVQLFPADHFGGATAFPFPRAPDEALFINTSGVFELLASAAIVSTAVPKLNCEL
jgi:hypothetical protein